jgi:hypothetical protein
MHVQERRTIGATPEEQGMPKAYLAGIARKHVPAYGEYGEKGSYSHQVHGICAAGDQGKEKQEDKENDGQQAAGDRQYAPAEITERPSK